jgi:hypothetical protein
MGRETSPYFFMLIQPSEEAMTAAYINELCSGRHYLDQLAKFREDKAAYVAKEARQTNTNKNFRHLIEVPQREYLQIANKYGSECWDDREFIRDFQKLEPSLTVNKI